MQENYQPFYPSEPFRITRFQMRHPVLQFYACLLSFVYCISSPRDLYEITLITPVKIVGR